MSRCGRLREVVAYPLSSAEAPRGWGRWIGEKGALGTVAFMSDRLPLNNTSLLKELLHDILSRFLRLAKQPSA